MAIRALLAISLVFLSQASATPARASGGFSEFQPSQSPSNQSEISQVPEVREIDPRLYQEFNNPAATHEFTLSFVLMAQNPWTQQQIETQVAEVAKAYYECKIRVAQAKIYEFRNIILPPVVEIALEPDGPYAHYARLTANVPRPAVYLVDQIGPHNSSYARGQFAEKPNGFYPPAVIDTVWLIHNINQLNKPYSVLGHELGHIFLHDGMHNGDNPANLMTVASKRTPSTPPAMCEAFRKHAAMRKISRSSNFMIALDPWLNRK